MRGLTIEPQPWEPTPLQTLKLQHLFAKGSEVVAMRGARGVSLWPLMTFAPVQMPGVDFVDVNAPLPQVYSRRNDLSLIFTPIGSDDACISEGDISSFNAFIKIFNIPDAKTDVKIEVRGFEEDFRKDAERAIGRTENIETVEKKVLNQSGMILWLSGVAGIGKSFLISCIVNQWLDKPPANLVLIPWRFKAGDDRCSRSSFLSFAIDRLQHRMESDVAVEYNRSTRGRKQIDRLREALNRFPNQKVVFVLDGLDEIAERDSSFAEEVPLSLKKPGVVWLCAGRPVDPLPEQFNTKQCIHVFPDGLPPMSTEDIRTMLLEEIGKHRARLIQNDRDEGERVVNPFVEKIASCAQGLPIYVRYVIGDILGNRFRMLNAGEQLPPSLDRYHGEMLKRCAVGSLQQVLTPIVASLAVAHEALTQPLIGEILQERGLATREDIAAGIVARAVTILGAMIRSSSTPEGKLGINLFHHSLRQHMEGREDMRGVLSTARRAFAKMALEENCYSELSGQYFFRWGVSHLVETGQCNKANSLLCSFDYIMNRLEALSNRNAIYSISADWRLVKKSLTLEEVAVDWEKHWRLQEHLLLHATAEWPAYRIFHQVSLDRARTGPWRQAALEWRTNSSSSLWPTFESDERDLPDMPVGDACVGVLVGHSDTVNACVFMANGTRVISASGKRLNDFSLRIWDVASHECLAVLQHDHPIRCIACDNNGKRCVFGDKNGRVILWDIDMQCEICSVDAVKGVVNFVGFSPDGSNLISAGSDGRFMRWNSEQGRVFGNALECGSPVTCGASNADNSLVALGLCDGRVLIIDPLGPTIIHTIDAFYGEGEVVTIALAANGGRLAVSGTGGAVKCWDISQHGSKPLGTWSQHPDSVTALALTPDGHRVLTGCSHGVAKDVFNRSVEVRRVADGKREQMWYGHCDFLMALAVNQQGTMAVSGGGDYWLRLWDLNVSPEGLRTGAEPIWISSMSTSGDRNTAISSSDDGSVRIWDIESRSCLHIMRTAENDTVSEAVYTPELCFIISGSEDGCVRLWDIKNRQMSCCLPQHDTAVNSVAVSPDGSLVLSATCCEEGIPAVVRVWSLAQWSELAVLKGHDEQIGQVAITPDGLLAVTIGWDGIIGLWNLPEGTQKAMIDTKHLLLRAVAISPDGKKIICSDSEGWVGEFDRETYRELGTYCGHVADVRKVAYRRDGRVLFTVSDDQSLRAWDTQTRKLIAVTYFDVWVTALCVRGAGSEVLVGFSDGRWAMRTLKNGPEIGPAWVTPVRIWESVTPVSIINDVELCGGWQKAITTSCPACGCRFETPRLIIKTILTISEDSIDGVTSLYELSESNNSGLLSDCPSCGHQLQYTSFLVDQSKTKTFIDPF